MKALVIGEYGFVMNYLIERLNREKCDVYTISGKDSKEKASKLPKHNIFEFQPGGLDVKYIIQCVQPDVVIFMGALNDGYDWDGEMIASEYSSQLTNILVWSRAYHAKHFIYLSTIDASEKKKMVVYDGEYLCKRYNDQQMKVTVLRFPVVYGPTHFTYEKLNRMEEICFEIIESNEMKPTGYDKFMAVYVSDAVDAIYKVASQKPREEFLYQVSGFESVSDADIAEQLTRDKEHPVLIKKSDGESTTLEVDGKPFEEEFHYSPHINFETGLFRTNKFVEGHYKELKEKRLEEQEIQSHKEKETLKENIKIIFQKAKTALENGLLFLIAVLLSYFLGSMEMFEGVDFFLLYIVIAALAFGVGHSVGAAVLSIAGYIFITMQFTGRDFTVVLSQYSVIFRMLFYLILAIMISYSILRYKLLMKTQEERMEDLQEEYELIYEVNKTNVEIKKIFEDRLLGYSDSIGKIYNIVSELDVLEPEKIAVSSLDVIKKIMHVNDVCIYKTGGEGYYHLIDATTEEAKSMKKSIQIHDYPAMSQALEMKDIFVNRDIATSLPRMAAPIYSGGTMIYVIMLWNMDFEQLNTYQKNLFLVLAKIITSSLEKGYEYERVGRSQKYYGNTDILFPAIFMERVKERLKDIPREEAQYSLIQVEQGERTLEETSRLLKELIRDEDKIGKASEKDTHIYVLVHAEYADAEYVVNKFRKNGFVCKAVMIDEMEQ